MGLADYTAIVEAGNAVVDLLRDNLTPEPLGNRELIALCSPHESENNQLTLYLYHIEEENQNMTSGYYQLDQTTQRRAAAQFTLRYLVTAHSKAPVQLRQADQHRIVGAAIQTLRDNPVVPQRYLAGSLAEEHAQLHLAVEKVPLEQLLKIWNNTSKEYKLSFVLMVTGVTIASKRKRQVTRITDFEVSVNPETHESLVQRSVSAVLRLRDGFLGTPKQRCTVPHRRDAQPAAGQAGRVPGLDRSRGRTAHPVGQHARIPDRGTHRGYPARSGVGRQRRPQARAGLSVWQGCGHRAPDRDARRAAVGGPAGMAGRG